MADLNVDELAPELARRLGKIAPDNAEMLEALHAAAFDVATHAYGVGDHPLPDDPRVRRALVPYAAAIFLSADAPVGNYGAVGDDTFPTLPVANDLSAKYAPRFAFLSEQWGIA